MLLESLEVPQFLVDRSDQEWLATLSDDHLDMFHLLEERYHPDCWMTILKLLG